MLFHLSILSEYVGILASKLPSTMLAELKQAVSQCFQHLRTLDSDKWRMDRGSGWYLEIMMFGFGPKSLMAMQGDVSEESQRCGA